MRKAGTKAANSITHGQATSLKREVTNAGFEPMDYDEKALVSKFKIFLEQTVGGTEIFIILKVKLQTFEDSNHKIYKYINWDANDMNKFFVTPYHLAKPWSCVKFSYLNVMIVDCSRHCR